MKLNRLSSAWPETQSGRNIELIFEARSACLHLFKGPFLKKHECFRYPINQIKYNIINILCIFYY
jgi:hypothetical protein